MLCQLTEQCRAGPVIGTFKPFGGAFGENIKQKGDVVRAIAQRCDGQFKRIDPKQQIFAEGARRNSIDQIFVGRTNQTKIDFDRCVRSHPHDFALFNDAQQFGLKCQGHA